MNLLIVRKEEQAQKNGLTFFTDVNCLLLQRSKEVITKHSSHRHVNIYTNT